MKPVTEHPDYKAASDRRDELMLQRSTLEREIQCADADAYRHASQSTLEKQAVALLDGEPATKDAVSFHDLAQKHRDVRVTERAIALQEHRLEQLRGRLSREATSKALPAYRKIMAEQARAAVALAAAIKREQEFLEEFDHAGYSFYGGSSFGLATFNFEPEDRLGHFLVDLVRSGMLDAREEFLGGKDLAKIRERIAAECRR